MILFTFRLSFAGRLPRALLGAPNFGDVSPVAGSRFNEIGNSVGSSQLQKSRPAKAAGGWS